jgi:RNA polymerase sigma factor (sigma-70 family)
MPAATDQHFFHHLVKSHYQDLYRYAFSLAKKPEDAADLVQATFTIWAEKGHQLQDVSKAKSWLFTTLHREFLSLYRKAQQSFSAAADPTYELEKLISPGPSVETRLDAKTVLEALSSLDETFRTPLQLFYITDLNYREIAEVLQVPLGTIMSRLARGKIHLRERLLANETRAQ